MALPLFLIGGAVVRAVGPRIVKEIIKRGGKKISQQAANKITQNPATITNINKIPKPSGKRISPNPQIRTAAGMKPFKPISGAGARSSGRKFGQGATDGTKLSKPTQGTGRANVKADRPSVKADRPSVKADRPSVKAKRPDLKSAPKVLKAKPKGNQQVAKRVQDLVATAVRGSKNKGSVPTGGARLKPSRISGTQRLANVGKAGVATGVVASQMPKKKEGPKGVQAMPTGPMSRPKRNAPNFGLGKPDPRGDQIKPTPGTKKVVMPKKFDGGYNKKEQRLVNITIDGKKATYEIPKGMTTKEATSLLKGTAKKRKGGRPGKVPMQRMKKDASGYKPVKKKNMVTNPEYFKASNRAAEKNVGAKNVPKKVKGFSKLPEKVQRKMNPKLAAMYKGGGSIGNGKVARQVKGFGAARKPKK